jgi:hypothetical protein
MQWQFDIRALIANNRHVVTVKFISKSASSALLKHCC